MVKKAVTIILCILMLLCLAACGENSTGSTSHEPDQTQPTTVNSEVQPGTAVFETQNIVRITFYGYYGSGTGSEVPEEDMEAITTWLASFTIGEKAPDLLAPGTNTYHVKIEYADGTVAESGLDVTTVDRVSYQISSGPQPECFAEIIAKATPES